MFDLGADLSNPLRPDPEWEPLRITQDYVDRLERWCDEFSADPLPALTSFILPGGSMAAAQLHVARTVARRAERQRLGRRRALRHRAGAADAEDVRRAGSTRSPSPTSTGSPTCSSSSSGWSTGRDGDILWVPGGERDHPARDRPPTGGSPPPTHRRHPRRRTSA